MSALVRCPRCGKLIALIFPMHYCKPKKKKRKERVLRK